MLAVILFFFRFKLPDLIPFNYHDYKLFKFGHELLAYSLCGLLGLHITAALIHHFYYKDQTLKRMIYFTVKPIRSLSCSSSTMGSSITGSTNAPYPKAIKGLSSWIAWRACCSVISSANILRQISCKKLFPARGAACGL